MDYYKDSGHLFAKLFHSIELPEFVKEGAYYDSVDALSDSSFGDPVSRSFPMNDRAHAFVSYAYAYVQRDNKIAAQALPVLEKAGAMYGITEDLKKLAGEIDGLLSKTAAVVPVADSDVAFQVALNTPTIGTIVGQGKAAAERACSRFMEVLREVPFENRTPAALDLIKAAEENGAEVPDDLRKIAGLAECNETRFQECALTRIAYISNMSDKDIAKVAIDQAKTPEDRLVALNEIDKTYKLARFFDRGVLVDPHRSVFNSFKVAEKVIKVGEKEYPASRWQGAGCDFEKAMVAALGQEKTAALIVDGEPALAGLTESEARLLNIYLL